jgi:hypothetical protein
MRRIFRTAFVLGLCVAGCSGGPAPNPSPSVESTGTITGVLYQVTGLLHHPASGVLTLIRGNGQRRQMNVPAGGHFTFPVAPGRYTLTAVHDCQRISVVVTRGAVSRADIQCGISTT